MCAGQGDTQPEDDNEGLLTVHPTGNGKRKKSSAVAAPSAKRKFHMMSCKQNITAPPGSKPSAQTSQARTGSRADARALIRQNMGRVAMPASSTALEVWRSQLRTQESDETGKWPPPISHPAQNDYWSTRQEAGWPV